MQSTTVLKKERKLVETKKPFRFGKASQYLQKSVSIN